MSMIMKHSTPAIPSILLSLSIKFLKLNAFMERNTHNLHRHLIFGVLDIDITTCICNRNSLDFNYGTKGT